MRILRNGSQGADVKRWQYFLIGQKFNPGPADGLFADRTHRATLAFQNKYGLQADGIVGLKTLGQAMVLGFPAVQDRRDPSHLGANWPPRPGFDPLTGTVARQRLFGKYSFVAAPVVGNAENIRILGDWEATNIVSVAIPQLHGVKGAPKDGRVRFHRLGAKSLRALWQAWDDKGLLDLVQSWQGAFAPRFIRGSRTVLSNHAFGTAFDINHEWNSLGTRPALVVEKGSVRELVPLANKHGFFWGGHFNGRPDGMHFELARLEP